MPACANKGCPNMARVGKHYCSVACYNDAVIKRNRQRKRKSSRRTREKYRRMITDLNQQRGHDMWLKFVDNLPSVDWEEELMGRSVLQLSKDFNISYYFLKRYLTQILRIDILAYGRERARHLIADKARLNWRERRSRQNDPSKIQDKKPQNIQKAVQEQEKKDSPAHSNVSVEKFIELVKQKNQ